MNPTCAFAPRGRLLAVALVATAMLAACAPSRHLPARSPRAAPLPERLPPAGAILGGTPRPVSRELLGTASYDLPLEANTWVEAEMRFLLDQRRDVVERWIQRGEFYEQFVRSVFREYGIPTDLYHLAMIESGFIPTARSSAGAAGMWQFMPATGREVNLRVDAQVDERLDPVRSTRAAARYLRSLYRLYGDWALAAAAYNAGIGRITRGLRSHGARGFWDLAARGDLAPETQHYVPRLYAMTIIARNRQRFGLPPAPATSGFAFDSIHVDVSVPLGELAEMIGVAEGRLADLNPHLHAGVTPDNGYWVWVPAGTGVQAQRAFLAARERRGTGVAEYTVKWGDSLGRIAERSGVPAGRIRELNPSIDFDRLLAGATIRLPAEGVERLLAASSGTATARADRSAEPPSLSLSVPTSNGGAARRHEVRWGETLSGIAASYGVPVARIQEANSLRDTNIRAGQTLIIPSPEPLEHVVQPGDTLWELAQRYGSSVEAIRRANDLGDRPIRPGQRLSVPAER